MDADFLDYYRKNRDLLDKMIPKSVLDRLLNKAEVEAQRGDAWEPSQKEVEDSCPFNGV